MKTFENNADVFPSATTARFFALVTSFLVAMFVYGTWFFIDLLGNPNPTQLPWLGLISITGASALAGTIYLCHPTFKARAFGQADEITSGSLYERIRDLCTLSQIELPRIFVDKDIRNADAIVFGWGKRKTILLGRNFRLMHVKKREEFDARILHELAHIKYGDATIAIISWAMLATTITLFAVIFTLRVARLFSDITGNWAMSWASPGSSWLAIAGAYSEFFFLNMLNFLVIFLPHCLFWLSVLTLEFKALLRVREQYADHFSRELGGSAPIYKTIAGQIKLGQSDARAEMFSNHPSRDARLRFILRPHLVGLPGKYQFFALAFIGGAISTASYDLLSIVSGGTIDQALSSLDINNISRVDPLLAPYVLAALAGLTLIVAPLIISIIFSLSRFCGDLIFRHRKFFPISKRAMLASAWLAIGYWAGHAFYPSNLSTRISDLSIIFELRFSGVAFSSLFLNIFTWFLTISSALILPWLSKIRGATSSPRTIWWVLASFGLWMLYSGAFTVQQYIVNSIFTREQVNNQQVVSAGIWVLAGLGVVLLCGMIHKPERSQTFSKATVVHEPV